MKKDSKFNKIVESILEDDTSYYVATNNRGDLKKFSNKEALDKFLMNNVGWEVKK